MYEGCLTNDRWKNKWPTHPHYFTGFVFLALALVLISALDLSPTLQLWGQHLLFGLWPSEANSYPWSHGGWGGISLMIATFSTVLCSSRKSHGFWDWGDGSVGKTLPEQAWGPEFDPQYPQRPAGTAEWVCILRTWKMGAGDPRPQGTASRAKWVRSGFAEGAPCQKERGE